MDAVAHHGDCFHSVPRLLLFVSLLLGCLTLGVDPNTRAMITNSCSTCLTVGTPLFILPLRLLMGSSVAAGCFQITAGKQQAEVATSDRSRRVGGASRREDERRADGFETRLDQVDCGCCI